MEFYKRGRASLMEEKSRVNQTFSDNSVVSYRLILQHPHRMRDVLSLEHW